MSALREVSDETLAALAELAEAATKFRTEPNPDQPGRCPSIDPYDCLQCTRSIHEDDQCRCGGIAWKKGTPRHDSVEVAAARLTALVAEVQRHRAVMGKVEAADAQAVSVGSCLRNPPSNELPTLGGPPLDRIIPGTHRCRTCGCAWTADSLVCSECGGEDIDCPSCERVFP